ncbi:MAG: hypothetical protein IJ272_11055 [Clostridia bacterium]|nr:hypothetical protein [Clostridia bacterium]
MLLTVFFTLVVGAFLLVLYILGLRRIVPTNEVHIVQRTKDTISYGRDGTDDMGNTYYQIPAWVPKWGVVVSKLPTTVIDIDIPNYPAYDKDRLPFVVDIKAFFRISDFNKAATRVFTINELKDQLTSIVKGAARSILAKENLEQIMSERNKYGDMFTELVSAQLKEWGVTVVKNIELMDIRDDQGSQVIQNIMAKKESAIEMEKRVEVAKNLKAAQEAEIIAKQEIELKQQDAKRQVGLRQAEVDQEVGIAQEKQRQEVQAQAKITAEKEMEVKKVQEVQAAEIEKQAATVRATQDKDVTKVNAEASVIRAEADKKVQVVKASAQKEQVELQAQADKTQVELKAAAELTAATNEAKGKAIELSRDLLEKAQVAGQIELFDKVNNDKEYQSFLIEQRKVEAMQAIGVEQAKNLSGADIKIFANAGSVAEGVNQAGKVLSPKTGLDAASMLEAFSNTPVGEQIIGKLLNKGEQ